MKIRLSTFRKRLSKADHGDQVPVTESVYSIEELERLQKLIAWSPSLFTGWRDKSHWNSAQLLVLDIDNGDYGSFVKLLSHYEEECLITFTESHQNLKNGKQQADCFRATFFLKEECFNMETYRESLKFLQERYAEANAEQGPDVIKYYWTSTGAITEVRSYFPGKKAQLIKVKKAKEKEIVVLKTDKSKIPLLGEYLAMSEESLESRRNEVINKLSYILSSHGYDAAEIKELIYSKNLERKLDDRYEIIISDSAAAGKKLFEERKLQFGGNFFKKNMTIEAFFEEFKLISDMTCSHNGIISLGEKVFSDDLVLDYITVEASKYQLRSRSKDVFRALINVWKVDKIEENIRIMTRAIAFVEPSNEICKFIEAVTGNQHPLDIAVMRHWIWQVKRKFKKLETQHHIMPIFYGKTRSGKTTAIDRLISPIKQLTMIAELAMVNDSRNDFNLIEKLVIFFDELGKAEKVVVSNLKQKITSSHITYRRLGMNQNMNGYNMASFIGASNEQVIDTIIDPTSARRFYEMKTLDKCDWNAINKINFLEIWQSVDEMEETAPIDQMLPALEDAQETIRAKDYIEEFASEYVLKPANDNDAKFVSSADLYAKLKEWLESQNKGMYIPSLSRFSRRLRNLVTKAPPTWVSGAVYNGFFVSKGYSGKIVIHAKDISLGS